MVPVSVCTSYKIPEAWCWDYSNHVLACQTCNGFCNRYRPEFNVVPPVTFEEFCELRDEIFTERNKLIAARHKEERNFFKKEIMGFRRNNPQ